MFRRHPKAKYYSEQPEMVLEEQLRHSIYGVGEFVDRFGRCLNRYKVFIEGRMRRDKFLMDEDFVFENGTTTHRQWHIKIQRDKRYEGRAEDVIGPAFGRCFGNACRWRYTMELLIRGDYWHVRFDDWWFLLPDGTMVKTARISKWGFKIGTLSFQLSRDRSILAGAWPQK